MPSLLERCFDSCGCQVKPSNGDGVAISVERTPDFTTTQHVRDIDRNPATVMVDATNQHEANWSIV